MDSSKKSLDVVVASNTMKHKKTVLCLHAAIRSFKYSATVQVGPDDAGLMKTDFANFAFQTLNTSGNIRPLCDVRSTDFAVFPTYATIENPRAGRAREGATRTGADIAVGRKLEIALEANYSYPNVSMEFLENATIEDAERFLQVDVISVLETTENNAILNGGGVNSNTVGLLQPEAGIPIINFGHASELNNLSRLYKLTGELPIVYSLQGTNRNPKNKFTWVMNHKTAIHIASMKGIDLALNDLSTGNAKLFGYDCIINYAMPDIAPNANAIIFGNFYRGVILVDKIDGFFLNTSVGEVGFVDMCFGYETGSAVVDKNALRIIKIAV